MQGQGPTRSTDRCQPSPHSACRRSRSINANAVQRTCGEIVLTLSDDGSQRIAGDDLIPQQSSRRPTMTCRRQRGRSEPRGRGTGSSSGSVIFPGCQIIARRPAPPGGDPARDPIDFRTKHVVLLQPESDTAYGVDEAQLGCPESGTFSTQVRQVNVDHVRVADPVGPPHLFEELGPCAHFGWPPAQLLEQGELDTSDGDVVIAQPGSPCARHRLSTVQG